MRFNTKTVHIPCFCPIWLSKTLVQLNWLVRPFLLQWPKTLNAGLSEVDPELFDIIEKEKNRQFKVRREVVRVDIGWDAQCLSPDWSWFGMVGGF